MTRFLAIAFALAAIPAVAAPTAQGRYADALARERTVRATLATTDATPGILREVRAVVKAYELVVKRYPASGYSDNALWQAGRLELDAFERFHDVQDRDAAVRLLRHLARAYDKSKLAKQVPEQLARVEGDEATPRPLDKATIVLGKAEGRQPQAEQVKPAAASQSRDERRLATIKDIRRTVLPDAVRVTIEFDGEVLFHDEKIADPSRVFVDIPGTRATPGFIDRTLRFESDADIVRQIRVGRHPNNTTRVVLDAGGVGAYSIYPLYDPYRLVIDCVREQTPLRAAAQVAATQPAPPVSTTMREGRPRPAAPALPASTSTPPVSSVLLPLSSHLLPLAPSVRRAPSVSPRAKTLIAQAHADAEAAETVPLAPKVADAGPVTPLPSLTRPAPAAPPVPNASGGFSIARQLGLGVSRIVIDAGHGGHDPGAQGRGVTEAELVLDIALRVEKLLEKVNGVEVILTRRTDEFIALQERTAMANRVGADLFLSIHANASPNPAARGVETYFLNFANNLSAAAVAARENAASGQAMGALPDLVKAIALNNKLDESKDFATQVQHAMVERLRGPNRVIKDLGVKQAPFVVLIGAAMPSVLAEISFVTNAQEARLLKSDAYRDRIADALFNAIRKYQTSLKNLSTVASQN